MKKYFCIFILFLTTQLIAAESLSPKNLNVEINFTYTNQSGQQTHLQNTLTMKPDSQWLIIGSLHSESATQLPSSTPTLPSSNHFLLLGKIEKADVKQTTLKFLVIDQDTKSNFIIEPSIIVNYNQKGEIQLHKNQRNIQFRVLAKQESSS